MDEYSQSALWVGLLALTAMQVVLSLDNVVLLTILTGQLPTKDQRKARTLGLIVAMASRILLLAIVLIVARALATPFFSVLGVAVSGQSVIFLFGGAFLMAKATKEIHSKLEQDEEAGRHHEPTTTLKSALVQIFVLDVAFSLDSVVTALGMSKIVLVQVLSVVFATFLMLIGIHQIADFVDRHPTVRMLAITFLLLIGFNLIAEGLGFDIPRGYTYFAMAWSIGVEMLNIRVHRRAAARGGNPHA